MAFGGSLWNLLFTPCLLSVGDGIFHFRSPVPPTVPQWNLSAVVRFSEQIVHNTCSPRLLLMTLYLTAPASGNRTSIPLLVMLLFLFMNQTALRCPPPISFPSLSHALVCPIATIRAFLHRSAKWDHKVFVLVNPKLHASMVAGSLNYWLVYVIATADVQGSVVLAHDVRKLAFSINGARRAVLSHILQRGFWV